MAKGSRTVINDTTHKNTITNINKHDTNTQNTNLHFNVNKTANSNINGNNVDGNSVTMQDSGNAGIQCFGMKPGDPACVAHLQNLSVPHQPVEHQIYEKAMNKMSYLREHNPTEYVQKLNAIQLLI